MNSRIKRITHVITLALVVMSMGWMVACSDDEAKDEAAPIASFDYAVSNTNASEIIFTNTSQNASDYLWDFGDDKTSVELNPIHTYAVPGTYSVSLTATNSSGESSTVGEDITIVDTDTQLTLLAGTSSKTWYLQREGVALGIGPEADKPEWWSFGGATPLSERPCILDDSFTFHRNGTFEHNTGGTLFIDNMNDGGWLEQSGCHDESETDILMGPNGEDLSAFANGGAYTFDFDDANNTLTLNGAGAYIGLPNKTADGDNYVPIAAKTYTIFDFKEGDVADSLQIALVGDGNAWSFYLVSYKNETDLPIIPGSDAPPPSDFSAEVLSSADGKSWKLAGVGSYKVGPTAGSGDWWGGPNADEVAGARSCQMDDEFIFTNGGLFEYDDTGDTWAEGYMGGTDACVDPATLPSPYDGFASGTYEFSVTEATETDPATVTVTGTGAFIGFNKAFNGGEYTGAETSLASEITYTVLEYAVNTEKEILTLIIDYSADLDATAFWTISIEHVN